MITKDEDLLGTLIHDVAHLLRLDIDKRLSHYNLTRVKWLALGIIHDQGPISQSELATELELGHASVGRLVDRLEGRGFVLRAPDPQDRRSYLLTSTSRAKSLITELGDVADDLRTDTLKGLSRQDQDTLKSGLQTLKKTLSARSVAILALSCVTSAALSDHSELFMPIMAAL